jgi:hypothetical protein
VLLALLLLLLRTHPAKKKIVFPVQYGNLISKMQKKKVKLNTLKWCCKISSFNQALKMKTKEKERRSDGSVRLPELQTCQLYQQIEGQSYLKHFQRAPLTKKHKRKKNKQKKQLELCNR